jgi:hypothetical protein
MLKEVARMSVDNAIVTLAENDDADDDCQEHEDFCHIEKECDGLPEHWKPSTGTRRCPGCTCSRKHQNDDADEEARREIRYQKESD